MENSLHDMDDCDDSIPVARIKEEKQAVQVEREELLANFEQHQQLEKQQQEEKRKVQPMVHCFFPMREEGHDANWSLFSVVMSAG